MPPLPIVELLQLAAWIVGAYFVVSTLCVWAFIAFFAISARMVDQ